jgi:hypothetical protein
MRLKKFETSVVKHYSFLMRHAMRMPFPATALKDLVELARGCAVGGPAGTGMSAPSMPLSSPKTHCTMYKPMLAAHKHAAPCKRTQIAAIQTRYDLSRSMHGKAGQFRDG